MRDYLDNHPITLRGDGPVTAILTHPLMVAFFLSIIAFVLILLDQHTLFVATRDVLVRGVSPVNRELTGMRYTLADVWSDVANVQQLRKENDALKHEISLLRSELIQREYILLENAQLRQQLAITEHHPWVVQGAEVIVRPTDAGRRVMTIARGSEDGVEVGMAVIGETDTRPAALVGIVEAVGLHTANVLLINDYSSRISARILAGETSALGLVTGQWQYGAPLRLEQLDRTVPLESGQVVVSAGLTGNLGLPLPLASVPAGIPIGTVSHIIKNDDQSQIAEIQSFVEPELVRNVWIILSHQD